MAKTYTKTITTRRGRKTKITRKQRRNKKIENIDNTEKLGGNTGNTNKSKQVLNCSPYVSNKRVNKSTCYTPEILIKIKDAYNKSHNKEDYVPWSNPQEIWRTLKTRLVNCNKEDCWLAEIKDKSLEKDIKHLVFAPNHPPEWINNPNEWLTDLDISKVMKQYETTHPEFKFIGPSPIDFDTKVERQEIPWEDPTSGNPTDKVCVWQELCHLSLGKLLENGKTKIGIVFNLDRYDEPGSHWVSLYINLGEPEPFVFYFDSTGRKYPDEIRVFIERIIDQGAKLSPPLKINKYSNFGKDHQKSNTECGMYSLFFLITMLTGKIYDTIDESDNKQVDLDFQSKLTLFKDAVIPDKYVELYRNKYFNDPV